MAKTLRTAPKVDLTEPMIEIITERFRVLGEPMRIRLLNELREGPLSVSELVERVGASQQTVSKHLGILHGVGIVERSKQGNKTLYAIVDESVFDLCDGIVQGARRRLEELNAALAPAA